MCGKEPEFHFETDPMRRKVRAWQEISERWLAGERGDSLIGDYFEQVAGPDYDDDENPLAQFNRVIRQVRLTQQLGYPAAYVNDQRMHLVHKIMEYAEEGCHDKCIVIPWYSAYRANKPLQEFQEVYNGSTCTPRF